VFDAPSENIAFGNLTINAPGKVVSLNKTLNICTTCNGTSTGSLTLIAGKIKLGAYNIYIKDKATIVANNAESYIITNGTGKLIQTGIGSIKQVLSTFQSVQMKLRSRQLLSTILVQQMIFLFQ
jgi:hypothetical protein